MHSGVGSQSREFVLGTIHYYNWVQIGGSIKHPDLGKIIDMNRSTSEETGVPDAQLKIYPVNGYGDPATLKNVISRENPDAIMHFTDPRFWLWLYQMEHEIRVGYKLPIIYYTIWDCPPIPHWNKSFYESCDMLMCISKQTSALVRGALGEGNYRLMADIDTAQNDCPIVSYVPHGLPEHEYFPIDDQAPEYNALQIFKHKILPTNKNFVITFNSRNIRRKMVSDLILAYKTFCDRLTTELAEKCVLVLKTQARDRNGTDLVAVKNNLCPDYDVVFIEKSLSIAELNLMYNISDITVNIASNEGFGLTTAESLMAGTPIIVNVTGGLQDQCGFTNTDGRQLTYLDYTPDWPSNHNKAYLKHGKWVKPVWPSTRSIQGSMDTPYIFDDRANWEDVADAIMEWYNMPTEKRVECGKLGREFVNSNESGLSTRMMSNNMIHAIDTTLKHKTNRRRFELLSTDVKSEKVKTGITTL